MKQNFLSALVFAFVMLAGCAPVTQALPTQTAVTFTASPLATSTRQVVPVKTSSPTMPAPTLTATIAVTPLTKQCLEIGADMPPGLEVAGRIVVEDEYGYNSQFLDLKTGKKHPVDAAHSERIEMVLVSPNGESFAYLLGSGNSKRSKALVVASPQNKISIPWQDGWITWNWLDNQRLVIGRVNPKVLDVDLGEIPENYGTYMVLNASSGQVEREITLDAKLFPIIPTKYRYLDGSGELMDTEFAELFFDPTLTRVVYFGISDDVVLERTILSDLSSGQVLASLPNILNVSDHGPSEIGYPLWAPDGQSFLIEVKGIKVGRDLYRVSINGEITQLTRLGAAHTDARIQNYSFSADQRYIAFWFYTDTQGEYHLGILDTITNKMVDTCIPAMPENPLYAPDAPYWSPDGRHQFVAGIDTGDEVGKPITIVVDVDQQLVVKVVEGFMPSGGWLVTP